jgi:hypothetical protein
MACLVTVIRAADQKDLKAGITARKKQAAKPRPLITVSKETTYLTKPLTKDGFVNYAQALDDEYRKGVTPENNFAVVFWQSFGPGNIIPEFREQMFEKLGIDPVPDQGDYYVTLHAMSKRIKKQKEGQEDAGWALFDQEEQTSQGPWSAKQFPELAEWVRINKKHVDRLVAASRRERFYSPMLGGGDPPRVGTLKLPALGQIKEIARALSVRAMLRLHEGDVEGAWQDLIACHRIARLVAQNPTLIGQLMAMAVETIACQGTAQLAHRGKLTIKQVERFQEALRKLPARPAMVECIERAERFMFLDMVAWIARTDPDKVRKSRFSFCDVTQMELDKLIRNSMIDWNIVLKMCNEWYDRLVEAIKKPTFAERKAAFDKFDEELRTSRRKLGDPLKMAKSNFAFRSPRKTVSRHLGTLLTALLTPAIPITKESENRWTMRVRLVTVALALAGYRADHDRYPTTLDSLASKYIPELPKDLYSDDGLIYKSDGKNYRLYSIGENQKDDGGRRLLWYDDIIIHTSAAESVVP